jgi:TonB family protein
MKPIHALFILMLFANTAYLQSSHTVATLYKPKTTFADPHTEGGSAYVKPDYSFYHTLLAVEQLTHHLRNNTQYPDIMIENAIEGTLVVKVEIDEMGDIKHTLVVKSPNAAFDKIVLQSVEQIKKIDFQQGRYEGKQVVFVPLKFSLN